MGRFLKVCDSSCFMIRILCWPFPTVSNVCDVNDVSETRSISVISCKGVRDPTWFGPLERDSMVIKNGSF
jgi:hypothetical protein